MGGCRRVVGEAASIPLVMTTPIFDAAPRRAAKDIIETFMVASNCTISVWLSSQGRSAIRRVVREPERWPRIVQIAREYGFELPAKPSAPALAGFLAQRRAIDPMRFPDLSLAVVKCLGPGQYVL